MNIYKSGVIAETVPTSRRSDFTIALGKNYYLPIKKRPIFFVNLKTNKDFVNFILDFSDYYINALSKETLMQFSGNKNFYVSDIDIENYDYSYPYLMFLSKFHYSKSTLTSLITFVHFDAERPGSENFYYYRKGLMKNLKVFTSYKVLKNSVIYFSLELNGRYLI
jgi:hypothetical protein